MPTEHSKRVYNNKNDSKNPELNSTSIGNYSILKTLGEGNFAKVKLAKHKITGAEVAIKVIDKTKMDEKKINKMYREVRILKLLNHPNIVKLYEVIETSNTVFLVMEYSTSGELYDYLVVHGKMKEKEARVKFRQILSAVSYCHKKRVIHRDLKAENLLLDANLNIKIADFGFSNNYDPDYKLDTFCGSPPYAAPELFQGHKYTGPEVDIWSLGVILYVMTTGSLPFDGKNLQEMRESVCRGKYRIPFYLSDACEKLIKKFLVRDPAKRASLDLFKDDPWINDGYTESPINVNIDEVVEQDNDIIDLIVEKYKINKEQLIDGLNKKVYNDISAIYYLMYYDKKSKENLSNIKPTSSGNPNEPNSKTEELPKIPSKTKGSSSNCTSRRSITKNDSSSDVKKAPSKTINSSKTNNHITSSRSLNKSARTRRFTVGGANDITNTERDAIKLLNNFKTINKPIEKASESKSIIAKKIDKIVENEETKPATSDAKKGESTPSSAAAGSELKKTASKVSVSRAKLPKAATESKSRLSASKSTLKSSGTTKPTTPSSTNSATGSDSVKKTATDASASATDTAKATTEPKMIKRVRHNTISEAVPSGIRNTIMQQMKEKGAADGSMMSETIEEKDGSSSNNVDPSKPRSLRFTINTNTTSSKPPDEIVRSVILSCQQLKITHKMIGRYLIECTLAEGETERQVDEVLTFEVEVCKLPRLENMYGLKFKRVSGSTSEYKDICEKILNLIKL